MTRPIACMACLFLFCLLPLSAGAQQTEAGLSSHDIDATPHPRQVEVAFVLDTTGSMSGLIESAKRKIWSIANSIVDQYPDTEIRFGLVGYRDLGDEYVTRHFPLTKDAQSIYAQLLRFSANGGGDTPESVNEALEVALTKLGWSDPQQIKASRVLFLVGDAPPQMQYKQDRKYPEIIADAVQKGIIVNTVQCGDMASTRAVWRKMARLGKGDYMAIPQDGGKITIVVTPYDEEIIILQRKLNMTVIPYGSAVRQSEVKAKTEMLKSEASAESAADMSSYINKKSAGKAVITGTGDLVEDLMENRAALSAQPSAALPPEMRKMSPDERAAYVKQKIAERKALSQELAELTKKRDAYAREQEEKTPEPADSFDVNVKKTLRKQLK